MRELGIMSCGICETSGDRALLEETRANSWGYNEGLWERCEKPTGVPRRVSEGYSWGGGEEWGCVADVKEWGQ